MTTAQKPFRFGVVVGGPSDGAGWLDQARRVESLGYATLLLPDTLFTPSPFVALASAAAVTATLRVGTWVLAAPLRMPGAVVRDTVTLHEMSGGRFELGLGAGRPGGERDAPPLGVTWGSPGERVGRVEETLAAVRERLGDAVPLVLAGAGPRMLGLAGKYAASLALPVPPLATVAEVADLAARAREAAGERGDALELGLQLVGVGDTVSPYIARQMQVTGDDLRERGAASWIPGDPSAAADALRGLREATGVSYVSLPIDFVDAVAPVTAQLQDA